MDAYQWGSGLVKIEDIKTGDKVWSYNLENKKSELAKVNNVFERKSQNFVKLHIGNDSITCTNEHPFFVNNTWLPAKELKKGDSIFTFSGNKAAINSTCSFKTDTATKVYNFEVVGNKDYYVSSTKVLVHNQSSLKDALKSTLERISKGIKFPHRNDGSIFKNTEGLLPKKPNGYYREFVHPTPGVTGPGLQRIIKGAKGEIFYSPNHYKTFINIGS